MALRKDGTCRIFNKEHPTGSDGLWTFDDHKMSIAFKKRFAGWILCLWNKR